MKILHVVGARPNFMKVAPVMRALNKYRMVRQYLVHTGQHYDINMSEAFFKDLRLPEPDFNLGVGSGSRTRQIAQIAKRIKPVLVKQKPDLVLVYGDINSTAAAAVCSAGMHIPVGHVEAGLRSFDSTMPEEINRIITDKASNILFTHSKSANKNLLLEGVPSYKIHMVGNVMIDTLISMLPKAKKRAKKTPLRQYGLVTLHRPANVDKICTLDPVLKTLGEISRLLPLIFPVHPRTKKQSNCLKCVEKYPELYLVPPLSYLDFLNLQYGAKVVITDSGGIQEETTYLGIPCLTLRSNTERPITISAGTNKLIGHDMKKLRSEVKKILNGHGKKGRIPPLWDGHAADRIAGIITSKNQ